MDERERARQIVNEFAQCMGPSAVCGPEDLEWLENSIAAALRAALAETTAENRELRARLHDLLMTNAPSSSASGGGAESEREFWKEHVPVTGTQHDPANGLIHGFCARCRVEWPCRWSPESRVTPAERPQVAPTPHEWAKQQYGVRSESMIFLLDDFLDAVAAQNTERLVTAYDAILDYGRRVAAPRGEAEREPGAPRSDGDGTARLCRALYGREARPRDYIGGSNAHMLHDAADRLSAPAPTPGEELGS